VDARTALRADCSRCVGLCCVAPAFVASADFALTKPAGTPCPNLGADHRCGIHDRLRRSGFPGCAVFDCFGAGQHVVALTLGGPDVVPTPAQRRTLHAALDPARAVMEVLHHLEECAALVTADASDTSDTSGDPATGGLAAEVRAERDRVRALLDLPVERLTAVDVDGLRRRVGPLLGRVSAAVRGGVPRGRPPRETGPYADLAGADLTGADLRGAELRGALLVGADLRGADLDRADLLGADLRGADVRGARLAAALFLTRPQLAAARGDARTTVPAVHERPDHWR
jgi:hypothetical protein